MKRWLKQIFHALVIAALGLFALLTGRFSLLFMSCSYACLWAVHFIIHAIAWRQTLTVERTASLFVRAGTDCRVKVSIQSTGRIPLLWVTVKDEWHSRRLFSFLEKRVEYEYTVPDIARGLYVFHEVVLYIEDCFGMMSQKRTSPSPFTVIVYPHARKEAVRALPAPVGSVDWTSLRPYAPGDRYAAIHWKWSVKKRQWIVRTGEDKEQSEADVLLLLDAAPRWFEQRVEIVAGWIAEYGNDMKWSLKLVNHTQNIADDRMHVVETAAHQHPLVYLAKIKPNDATIRSAEQALDPITRAKTPGMDQTIYFFVSEWNDAHVRMCRRWQHDGKHVAIAWCLPKEHVQQHEQNKTDLQHRRFGAGLRIVRIHFAEEIEAQTAGL